MLLKKCVAFTSCFVLVFVLQQKPGLSRDDSAVKNLKQDPGRQLSILLSNGKTAEVIKLATATLAADPRNVDAYYCRAIAYQSNRLTQDKAIQDLDQAATLKPDMVQLYILKASILHQQQEDELALPVIEKASALMPGGLEILVTKAEILNALRRPNEALALENIAISGAPKNDKYRAIHSQTLKQLNRLDESLKELDEAIKLNPTLIAYREERMTLCAHEKHWSRVLADCDFVLATGPHRRDTLQRRGAAHVALKQYPEAIADFNMAIKETRSDTQMRVLHAQLKDAYQLSGDSKNASAQSEYLNKLDADIQPL